MQSKKFSEADRREPDQTRYAAVAVVFWTLILAIAFF